MVLVKKSRYCCRTAGYSKAKDSVERSDFIAANHRAQDLTKLNRKNYILQLDFTFAQLKIRDMIPVNRVHVFTIFHSFKVAHQVHNLIMS